MERLNLRLQAQQGADRLAWELRRGIQASVRRFGNLGWVLLAVGGLAALAWRVGYEQSLARQHAEAQLDQNRAVRTSAPVRPVDTSRPDGRERFRAFDEALLVHEDIPTVVQDLINLAEDERLTLARGEYRPQMDLQGGFLRYRMALPVKGDAQAIHRFMQAALRTHKTLALESVHFKRDRIASTEVEARLQWVVLAHAPTGAKAPSATKPKIVAQGAVQ